MILRKHLLTSSEVPEVSIYKGIEGEEVFAKHLLNTSSIILNCTPKVGQFFCIYIHIAFGCLYTPIYSSISDALLQYLLGGYSSISDGGIVAFRKKRSRYCDK